MKNCKKNEECGEGEYCYVYEMNCNGSITYPGYCRNAKNDAIFGKKTPFITAKIQMDLWSTRRFCEVLNAKTVTANPLTKCTIDDFRADFGTQNYYFSVDKWANAGVGGGCAPNIYCFSEPLGKVSGTVMMSDAMRPLCDRS